MEPVIYLISLTPHCSQLATFCFVNSFSSLSGPGNDENVMSSLQSISRECNAFDSRSPVIENKDKADTYLLKIDPYTGIVSYSIMLEKLCGNLRHEVTTKRLSFSQVLLYSCVFVYCNLFLLSDLSLFYNYTNTYTL
jgi:hypothetical protein